MWLYTTDGFFSITESSQFCSSRDDLQVRARVLRDLEQLRERLLQYQAEWADISGRHAAYNIGEIIETPGRDYRYRMVVDRGMIKLWMTRIISEIDYSNFKDAADDGMEARHEAYLRCWSAMHWLQQQGLGGSGKR